MKNQIKELAMNILIQFHMNRATKRGMAAMESMRPSRLRVIDELLTSRGSSPALAESVEPSIRAYIKAMEAYISQIPEGEEIRETLEEGLRGKKAIAAAVPFLETAAVQPGAYLDKEMWLNLVSVAFKAGLEREDDLNVVISRARTRMESGDLEA